MTTMTEMLAKELVAMQGPGAEQSGLIHIDVFKKADESRNKAQFVLQKHGAKDDETPYQRWLEPIPLTLPDGVKVDVYLMGHYPINSEGNTSDSFDSIECLVEPQQSGEPQTLFELTAAGPRWWDGRQLTHEDAVFMSEMVDHVYNLTFVPAGE